MTVESADAPTKILLDEGEMPRRWYNLIPDLPAPPPPVLHPGTLEPVGPDDLAPLFPMALIAQEVTPDRFVDIPEEVLDVYRLWRPSPLVRARRLERALGTPARIYYKYEGVSPAGSHKPNTAVPQAYYNAAAGVRGSPPRTGAGQWGTALAFACAQFGLGCEIWQVRASYDQKPYRKLMIETFGGTIHPSPSALTEAGRRVLAAHPDSPGSLGYRDQRGGSRWRRSTPTPITHSAACSTMCCCTRRSSARRRFCSSPRSATTGPDRRLHRRRLELRRPGVPVPAGEAGRADGADHPRRRAAACPSLTKGVYAYDFGDTAGMTPLMKMHTLGHDFIPDPIHAGGLRYHGMSPLLSHVYELGSSRRSRRRSGSVSRPASGSRVPRASCRRRSRRTPWPPASRRRCAAARPANPRSSSPPCAVTAC
jgi:tryptophan synthase beta chain